MVRSLSALALFVLLAACSAEEPRLVVQATTCWGHADCSEGLVRVRSALGADVAAAADLAAVGASGCGPVVDCSAAPPVERPAARPLTTVEPATAAVAPSKPTPEPPTPAAEPVAAASSSGCDRASASELEKAASLTPSDLLCLADIALGSVDSSDADRQIAAIALYNRKASGWQKAVEAVLKRPSLKNAPALNFAGIKTAYDRGSYPAVVARANVVWRNLDKGYQLSASDKTFLTEFACRAAGQSALQGSAPGSGLDWCERWMARASKAGTDTGPIQDLIDQLE